MQGRKIFRFFTYLYQDPTDTEFRDGIFILRKGYQYH